MQRAQRRVIESKNPLQPRFRKLTTTIRQTPGFGVGIAIGIVIVFDSDFGTDSDPADARAPEPQSIFMHLDAPKVHGRLR
jgi:hypothetical protein